MRNTPFHLKQAVTVRILFPLFAITFCLMFYLLWNSARQLYCVDLRNRVVGARLMGMKVSPYFFKWNTSYPETLLDPLDKCNIRNNMTTSPPSVLWAMQPLTNVSYSNICFIWIGIHFLFFLLMWLPFFILFKHPVSHIALLVAGMALLISDFWIESVLRGQSHFILPAVLANIFLLVNGQWKYRFEVTGLLLTILIWFRPNAALLLPFMFFCTTINRRPLFTGLAAGTILLATLTFSLQQQQYWIDFVASCREWVAINNAGIKLINCPHPDIVEGKKVFFYPYTGLVGHSQVSNINTIVKQQFHYTISPVYLMAFWAISYGLVLWLVIKKPFRIAIHACLAGLLVYWLAEVTAPIAKMSYYYVELFIVMLFLAAKIKELPTVERVLFIAAFIIPFLHFVPMHLFLAEICTMACLVMYLFREYRAVAV